MMSFKYFISFNSIDRLIIELMVIPFSFRNFPEIQPVLIYRPIVRKWTCQGVFDSHIDGYPDPILIGRGRIKK